jgi:hypothetical protein
MAFIDPGVVSGEVEAMLALLRGGETVEAIRALIGTHDPTRRAIRLRFDAVVSKHGGSVERIPFTPPAAERKRGRPRRLSSKLKCRV